MSAPGPLDRVRPTLRPLEPYGAPEPSVPTKLDANECPWPLPDEAQQRIAQRLASQPLHRYPDPGARALRDALVARVGGSREQLVPGAGSDEVIAMLMATFSAPRAGAPCATVLYPEPTFSMYRITALAQGLEPRAAPLDADWGLDRETMLEAIETHRPSLVFLATPNNPTGRVYDDRDLEAIIQAAPDSVIVVDEAYAPFARRSWFDWCDRFDNLVVLGTLSKVGLAAARIGWGRMHPDLAREVDKTRAPFNLSVFAQTLGELALTELAPVLQSHVDAVIEERGRLHAALDAHPRLRVYPSDANFLLAEIATDPDELVRRLREEHEIAIRGFGHEGRLAGHVRITVGRPDENDRLLDALHQLLPPE
jgi:histidinol-phosphate aminotransferase